MAARSVLPSHRGYILPESASSKTHSARNLLIPRLLRLRFIIPICFSFGQECLTVRILRLLVGLPAFFLFLQTLNPLHIPHSAQTHCHPSSHQHHTIMCCAPYRSRRCRLLPQGFSRMSPPQCRTHTMLPVVLPPQSSDRQKAFQKKFPAIQFILV